MFQFTHPGRGATARHKLFRRLQRSFNSRTPGGVRLLLVDLEQQSNNVSIHAPREGCDVLAHNRAKRLSMFQFTHPGRGATKRAPPPAIPKKFQFTHPGRGATVWVHVAIPPLGVSIHAPREGCDSASDVSTASRASFNSRTPGGVRLRR